MQKGEKRRCMKIKCNLDKNINFLICTLLCYKNKTHREFSNLFQVNIEHI